MAHLVLDTVGQERWRKAAAAEASAAKRQAELQQEILSNTITVEDDAGRSTSDIMAQMGKALSCQDVMDKLKLCNPNLIFELSIADATKMGVYIHIPEKLATGSWSTRKVHICGMEAGIMPEFSVMHRTTKKVANPDLLGKEVGREVPWMEVPTFYAETRGWRTVLIRLLKAGIITRSKVNEHFGWTPSHESEKWAKYTGG
jgi:urease gamma subunit